MTSAPARFEDLIERHHDELYIYLWRLLSAAGRREGSIEVEDLLQDVFERAYRAYPRLRPESNVRAWLYKIATNTTLSALRQAGQASWLDIEEAEHLGGDLASPTLEQTMHLDEVEAMRAAIVALPPSQRAAVVMRYLQGLEYAEIAAVLNCSQESARANVSHGLRRLRRILTSLPT